MVDKCMTESISSKGSIEYFSQEITQTIPPDQKIQFYQFTTNGGQQNYTEEELTQPENRFRLITDTKTVKRHSSQAEKKEVREFVDAVITKIYENSVYCKILLNDDSFEIQLPNALMPEGIFEGMPISIGLDRACGYVTPVVKRRKNTDVDIDEELEELDRLISNL